MYIKNILESYNKQYIKNIIDINKIKTNYNIIFRNFPNKFILANRIQRAKFLHLKHKK